MSASRLGAGSPLGDKTVTPPDMREKCCSDFLRRVRLTIERYRMVEAGQKIVVAVSGGVDSMTLLECLWLLKEELDISLVVAHLDHGLRGEESYREYLFVEAQVAKYGVPFEGGRLKSSDYRGGGSLQERARLLRYEFYRAVQRKQRAHKIAQGHHRDDHAETLLMRMLRGTGTTGLRGIPAVREGIYIRPLIEVSRREIEEFSRCRRLVHIEDPSNRKEVYFRNTVRHRLLPVLRETCGVSQDWNGLVRTAAVLSDEDRYLEAVASHCFKKVRVLDEAGQGGQVVLRRNALAALHPALQRRVLRAAYMHVSGSPYGPPFAGIEKVRLGLGASGRPHLHYCLPGGVHVHCEYDLVRFSREDLWAPVVFDKVHAIGGETHIPDIGLTVRSRYLGDQSQSFEKAGDGENRVVVSLGAAIAEARIRNVRPGDRFFPLGMGGCKKLKDFFIDEKVPRSVRKRTAIFEVEGNIVWVVGMRIDERYRVTPSSSWRLELQWERARRG